MVWKADKMQRYPLYCQLWKICGITYYNIKVSANFRKLLHLQTDHTWWLLMFVFCMRIQECHKSKMIGITITVKFIMFIWMLLLNHTGFLLFFIWYLYFYYLSFIFITVGFRLRWWQKKYRININIMDIIQLIRHLKIFF